MIENMQHISTKKWKQQCKNLTEIPSTPTALEVILLTAEKHLTKQKFTKIP
jgi:hypothetical protein